MKYFLDTEFIEDGKTIDLISIGMIAEDGRELYCINSECDFSKASPWVVKNVISNLTIPDMANPSICKTRKYIANSVLHFTGFGDPKPELWGYYADYDWVVFCQLFGTMMDLPNGFPMYCRDIKQLCDYLGNPKLPEQGKGEHHALADAKWNKQAYEFLESLKKGVGK